MDNVFQLNCLTVESVAFSLAHKARQSKLPVTDILFDETTQAIRVMLWIERSKVNASHYRSYYMGMDHNREDGQYWFSVGFVDSSTTKQTAFRTPKEKLTDWEIFFDEWSFSVRRLYRECMAEGQTFDPALPARILKIPPP